MTKTTTPSRAATAATILLSVLTTAIRAPLLARAGFADDEKFVTCGSAIKLTHVESGKKFLLQSEERQLQTGSGQQLVTAAEDNRTPKGLWQVREGHNAEDGMCETGVPIKCGSIVRLMHLETGTNLHTHAIRSPLSNQHEVSCFGEGGVGDSGDDWTVVCDGVTRNRALYWVRGAPIQLRSVATGRWLGASSSVQFSESNCGRGCPIMNHLEVFGRESNDSYSRWTVELGVHLHK
ncbi:hypothetical protein ACHAW5_011050 [Stephanodiscus triporus]|uniref:MIR domain-containing protein n=1 Tax=Stephanodiscus triporus TaxID=2934178 RepID=A0ABD3NM76_9STRA